MFCIRINDHDIKDFVVKVNKMYAKVEVIETKCISMEKHLVTQNGRLNKHADEIQNIEVAQEGFKTSQKYMMIIVGGIGGLGGSLLTILVKFLLTGGA